MNSVTESLAKYKRVIAGVKIIACMLIVAWLMDNLFIDGMDHYVSYEDNLYENEYEERVPVAGAQCIEQTFYSQGSALSNITLYLDEPSDSEVIIQMLDGSRKILMQETINLRNFTAGEWNRISIDCNRLKKNGEYVILLKGEDLSNLFLTKSNSYSDVFAGCAIDGIATEGTLAVGLQFTDRYMQFGFKLKLAVDLLYTLMIAVALCFTVLWFENIFIVFKDSEKKQGFLYALYFSVYTTLYFNPLDSVQNEVTEFKRIIGEGMTAGVDVSKRISNFNHWFLVFVITFSLFFMLANYIKDKELTDENKKAMNFLDNVIVVANVILGLRCVAFFYKRYWRTPIFHYSDTIITLIIFLLIAYILLDLGSRISLEKMEALMLSGWNLALPAAVIITHAWTDGRVLAGLQVFLSIFIVLVVKYSKIDWEQTWISSGLNVCTMFLSLLPFCTSFYIELVTLLNRHEVFWTHLRRNYFGAVGLGLLIMVVVALILIKRGKKVENWKRFSYPTLVLGFSCLFAQIPVSTTYKVDMDFLMETANSSILISDFLRYGDIPIVQHYGGHMMSVVWEGLFYALLNNDYSGAVFSPYEGYWVVSVAILFFIFMKHVWNEDAAVLTMLFVPFYSSIGSWGLGIMMVLAAMAYVRKNTYVRAALFWGSFVWCSLYRLDLGFAFGLACAAAFFVYIFADKKWRAFKQLAVTLAGWIMAGGALWFGICIVKGINPPRRLLEFLMISLSNQNWAFSTIGDLTKTVFSWAYLVLPFLVAIGMAYSVLSERIRENLGTDIWMANLILGFSFFFNFSRGLVRHSLVEESLSVVWSAYLFLAVFIVAVTNRKKAMLPVYISMVLLSGLLLSGKNYADQSLAETGVEKIGRYTETWTHGVSAGEEGEKLYWSQLHEDRQVINRVQWDQDLVKTVEAYAVMLDALLDDDETYVDCCCDRTMLYSLLGRRDPVYVSQSPLQLSGQFTQEEFVKEIQGVPIVLMPYGSKAFELDDVPDSYRYYKVYEYIYRNYVPLCTYEDMYSLWCLTERYDDMVSSVRNLMGEVRRIEGSALLSEDLTLDSGELAENENGSVMMNAGEEGCEVSELQNILELAPHMDNSVAIAVEYEADAAVDMQLFYTTEQGEDYTGDKISDYALIEGSGTAYYEIPVTQYTRLRLCIPEGGHVKINSFATSSRNCRLLACGDSSAYRLANSEQYDDSLSDVRKIYKLKKLPVIWGEDDRENSADNRVLATLKYEDGVYRYALSPTDYGTDGNYLKVSMNYAGYDRSGKTDMDDETVDATIQLGKMTDGKFDTKYTYSFIAEEGHHDYMFRISNDYNWYLGETDGVILESEEPLYNVEMEILEGD